MSSLQKQASPVLSPCLNMDSRLTLMYMPVSPHGSQCGGGWVWLRRCAGGQAERAVSGYQSSSLALSLCLQRHEETGASRFRLTLTFLIFFFFLPQIIQSLLELDQNRSKLKLYIRHLTALCHDRDPLILRGLTPPAAYKLDDDQAAWENELQKMTQEQVRPPPGLGRQPRRSQLLCKLMQWKLPWGIQGSESRFLTGVGSSE